MNKEAMKLALAALEESLGYVEEEAENAQRLYGQYPTRQARIQGLKDDVRKHMEAIAALREALAEQPAQQEPVALLNAISAEATELIHKWRVMDIIKSFPPQGIYYTPPAQQEPEIEYCTDYHCAGDCGRPHNQKEMREFIAAEQPTQQEPEYAWPTVADYERDVGFETNEAFRMAWNMARTTNKMLGYTSPPAQRKPLDAGEISRLWKRHTSEDGPHHSPYDDDGLGFARAIEAAHGIKENT